MKNIFKYIKASQFLPDYCGIEYNVTTRHKMRGTDGNKKPIDFTDEEKKAIKGGLKKMLIEFRKI
jgi:hypothetical protein